MADLSDDAVGADDGAGDASHTIYAATPGDVRAVLQRLQRNDPHCTSVVLTLAPPYIDIAEPLAAAIKDNTMLTSLKLELDPGGDIDEIVGDGGLVDVAVTTNSTITVLAVKGASIPEEWPKFGRRNTCLLIKAPQPLRQANVKEDESIDLTTVEWAFPAGKEFDDLVEEEGDESDEDEPSDAAGPPKSDSDPWLGNGSYGAVYRVRLNGEDVAAKTHFALQKPKMYGLANADARKAVIRACKRELSALRRLEGHRNVVGFRGVAYTVYRREAMPTWICMDLAVKNLEARIKAGEVRFVSDMHDIVTGLEYIHSQGMIHRDMKPQNVLVSIHGWLMVADLGVTRVSHMLSKSMTAGGTPAYLAPDAQESEYDTGRDVYAAGVMGMEMVLRESPGALHSDRVLQVERAVNQWPPCAWLVRRCTAASSSDRPSCRGLQVALQALTSDAEAQAATARADAVTLRTDEAQRRSAQFEAARNDMSRRLAEAQREAEALRVRMERAEADADARAAEAEAHQREAQEAREEVADLTRRLAESERRVAEAEAAPHAAPATSPHLLHPPGHDTSEAAMRILNHGVGPYPPCEEAVRLLRSAAAQGNPDALCELGFCLYLGRGARTDWSQAEELWRQAMAKGSVEAAGHLALVESDYHCTTPPALIDAAAARWRQRAEQGHADAQDRLGRCYMLGIGVAPVASEAVRWYRLSADQGCATAQNSLGACYNDGYGVGRDKTEAVRLYRLAADQGHSTAQSNLGWQYKTGAGVQKNQVEAVRLFRLSADHEDRAGQYALGLCYRDGVEVAKDLGEARRWLTLSADQGYSAAQEALAKLPRITRI